MGLPKLSKKIHRIRTNRGKKMIILVTGDFGVGKDVFSNLFVEELNKINKQAGKILSYTTRTPRNAKDFNNHRFAQYWNITPNETYFNTHNIVAHTTINNEHYWTEKEQFTNKYNIYVIDKASIIQVIKADIDITMIIEVKRKKSLINIPKERANRKQNKKKLPKFIKEPYIIENNGTIEELHEKTKEFVKKYFTSE